MDNNSTTTSAMSSNGAGGADSLPSVQPAGGGQSGVALSLSNGPVSTTTTTTVQISLQVKQTVGTTVNKAGKKITLSWDGHGVIISFPTANEVENVHPGCLFSLKKRYKGEIDLDKALKVLQKVATSNRGSGGSGSSAKDSTPPTFKSWVQLPPELALPIIKLLLPDPQLVRIRAYKPRQNCAPRISTEYKLSPLFRGLPDRYGLFKVVKPLKPVKAKKGKRVEDTQRNDKENKGSDYCHYDVVVKTPMRENEATKKEIWLNSRDYLMINNLELFCKAVKKDLLVLKIGNLVIDLAFFKNAKLAIKDLIQWLQGAFPDTKNLWLYHCQQQSIANSSWCTTSAWDFLRNGFPIDMVKETSTEAPHKEYQKVKDAFTAANSGFELELVAFELSVAKIITMMEEDSSSK